MEAARGHDMTTTAPPTNAIPHSPWHSPVPYLFGGLAAMLGLIAFALLILACSYWKLSGFLDSSRQEEDGGSSEGDVEAGTRDGGKLVFEEKILVIMAGEAKPTFLATPVSSRPSYFKVAGDGCRCATEKSGKSEVALENNAAKQQGCSDLQSQRLAQPSYLSDPQ